MSKEKFNWKFISRDLVEVKERNGYLWISHSSQIKCDDCDKEIQIQENWKVMQNRTRVNYSLNDFVLINPRLRFYCESCCESD